MFQTWSLEASCQQSCTETSHAWQGAPGFLIAIKLVQLRNEEPWDSPSQIRYHFYTTITTSSIEINDIIFHHFRLKSTLTPPVHLSNHLCPWQVPTNKSCIPSDVPWNLIFTQTHLVCVFFIPSQNLVSTSKHLPSPRPHKSPPFTVTWCWNPVPLGKVSPRLPNVEGSCRSQWCSYFANTGHLGLKVRGWFFSEKIVGFYTIKLNGWTPCDQ